VIFFDGSSSRVCMSTIHPTCGPDRMSHCWVCPISARLRLQLRVVACVRLRVGELDNISPGRAGFRQRKNWASLPHRLQAPQGMTGICLIEEVIAVADERLSVHAANIVESQETAGIDGYPHMLSMDFRRKLAQSIGADRVIRPGCTDLATGPDNLGVTER
jgi:hypothetical protein